MKNLYCRKIAVLFRITATIILIVCVGLEYEHITKLKKVLFEQRIRSFWFLEDYYHARGYNIKCSTRVDGSAIINLNGHNIDNTIFTEVFRYVESTPRVYTSIDSRVDVSFIFTNTAITKQGLNLIFTSDLPIYGITMDNTLIFDNIDDVKLFIERGVVDTSIYCNIRDDQWRTFSEFKNNAIKEDSDYKYRTVTDLSSGKTY